MTESRLEFLLWPGTAHCWHNAPDRHLVTNHQDIKCCWCAKTQCVSGHPMPGHGPNSLETAFDLPPPEKCPNRDVAQGPETATLGESGPGVIDATRIVRQYATIDD